MVELLAPAGSPEALDAAAGAGADAVYLGLRSFNARLRSVNFGYPQFEAALRGLHRMGRRLYVAVNTVFEQREADRLYQLLKYLAALGPDGLIVQDFGVISLAREHFPGLKLHASTQMNIASARGVNLLSKYGVSRAVLARELSLREIRDIRMQTNAELEVFVHGALCVSASGLCLFSSYLGGKSANRGICTQACRRLYRPAGAEGQASGGYFFSPGDLQLMERLPALADAGVNACKIEGRMKSAEYVGAVVSAYRTVIDALGGTGEAQAIETAQKMLLNDFSREKTVFYFDADPENLEETTAEAEKWLKPDQAGGTGIFLGNILRVKGSGEQRRGLLQTETPLEVGDSVRLHRADDSERRSHKLAAVEDDPAGGRWVSIPEGFAPGDAAYLIQTKAMSRRYAPVLPRNLGAFKRAPGRDAAPVFSLPGAKKGADRKPFPPGLYVGMNRIEDLYVIQSVRPAGVLLGYTRKVAAYLLGEGKPPLPFLPGEVILSLDPYFPQALDEAYREELPELMRRGYRRFMLNNPGHFSYFRGEDAALIAGPYLYVFNRWANRFVAGLGADFFVSPLENNRQNLERTVEPNRRVFAFITVFAYPALFRIRGNLGRFYDFRRFSDARDEFFALAPGRDGTLVLPEKPFSIVDKIPFLEEAGYRRFIADISGGNLKKSAYKDLLRAIKASVPLPNTTRFNWKDGFYREE